ncbi:hypothetical protein KIH86_01435 [Paenibacillus sp. HN-1]|uniref:hypothetical protein n=1 Tax=Paenibacillus TaxID=44249 RepID=UPI001CA8FEBA|nr:MULTISPECIES: hypothetical protein [Paenibacillus]MBY9079645.1 hypothetical protein [Paenibacillus sp. CGMCC 1.18879]MBY9082896.1 hypothetical protein [Paenibacillus sinensis]
MRTEMSRADFDAVRDHNLGQVCVEPVFRQIRGKSMAVKGEALAQLNEGQQAVCMFEILYRHAVNSPEEHYGWISYLLSQPSMWQEVLRGLEFFQDTALIPVLERGEAYLRERNLRLGRSWEDNKLTELERDGELKSAVEVLHRDFQVAALQLNGDYRGVYQEKPGGICSLRGLSYPMKPKAWFSANCDISLRIKILENA